MAKATKKTTTSMTKWDKQLADLAVAASATEKHVGTGSMISTKGGRLAYKGAEIPGNKMNVIVLDHVIHNVDYAEAYDPENGSSPRCYAFGREDEGMAPHADVPEDDKQNDTCKGCPQNEWGSAERGKGKHCGNKRRLAVLAESDLEDIAGAEVAYLHVPVMSVKGWAGYVRQCTDVLNRPPLGVLTEISLVPDTKSTYRVEFKQISTIDDGDLIEQLITKAKTVQKEIEFPYVQIEKVEKPQRRGGRTVVPPRAPAGKSKAAVAGKRSKF